MSGADYVITTDSLQAFTVMAFMIYIAKVRCMYDLFVKI